MVDDERVLCDVLRINLELAGYSVDTALSAEEALTLQMDKYHLFVLDVMMGQMDGFTLARHIRENPAAAETPIIFCTAMDAEEHLVKGFDSGADDYIKKPFSMVELLARVGSVLRRSYKENAGARFTFGNMIVDSAERKLTLHGEEVELTKKEFDLLFYLVSNANRVFTRDEILEKVWEEDVVVVDRTIDVNVNRLRKKLGEYGKNLFTKSGYGYGFKTHD